MTSQPGPVRFEHRDDSLGLGTSRPRLSWSLSLGSPEQRGYEIEVRRDGRTWNSGRVDADSRVLVAWPTAPLASRESASVRVRVWTGEDGEPSPWSEPRIAEAGLLAPGDWHAVPVGPAWPQTPGTERRPALVRRLFDLSRPISRARLYVTAHGLYEVEVNGARVGREALTPGWTVYDKRLRYYTYDVTDRLTIGPNAIGAWLGDGWYRGRLGFDGGAWDLYGTDLALLAQLEITHDDGAVTVIATDATWTAAPGPILAAGLYDGERYDARLEDPNWSRPGPTPHGIWTPVRVGRRDPRTLVAPDGPPVRCTEQLSPVAVAQRGPGRYLLDFGQNLVGRLRLTLDGPAGATVTVRHAEALENGDLAMRPLRGARATDSYTLRGGPAVWEPRFTVHGFRYAEIDGWPGELGEGAVIARVHHTDMTRTGWFSCSDPLITRLHENVVWSMRGNFVDIPTDCPARDERLGWTGDLQIFAPTAAFLYDCAGMLDSWLDDVAAEQLPDGTVPWYVPVIPGGPMWTPIRPGAAWGDVAVLTPWTLYQRFGDPELLRRHYPAGRAWVDLMERLAGPDRLWDTGFQLGDWLDPAAPPDDPAASLTDPYLVATAYFARSAAVLARTARELGYSEAHRYQDLADQVAAAFRARHVLPDGRLSSDTATAYSLAIAFDLLEKQQARSQAGARLAELVARDGYRISTGFVGTPLICDALAETGHVETAYRLLEQTECPSWLYPVTMGATTIWERWDSLRPDGTLNPGGMTSFNHYALGAVADWLHRTVAGLAPHGPGYRRILFRPRPGGTLSSASARHETPYGTAAIVWSVNEGTLTVHVTVPPGCEGDVDLPGQAPFSVGPGEHTVSGTPNELTTSIR